MFTVCGLFFAIWPLAYLAVPKATFIASLPVPLFGSNTKSSITNLLCSEILTEVASVKVS